MVIRIPKRAAPGLFVAIGLICHVATVAVGCPYSIRDSAFIGGDSRPSYQLLLITDSEVEALRDYIDAATTAWLSDANVTAEIVSTNSATVRAVREELAANTFPPDGLTVVLVSPDSGATHLGSLAAEEITLDTVMQLIAAAVESPVRSQMRDQLVDAWCVLLVLHRDDPEAAKRAAETARTAGDRIVGTTTEMDRTVENPPVVIVMNKTDPAEQVLLDSLGMSDEDSSASENVRVAMLTGRGELRGPVLEGDGIHEESVYELLEMLGRNCTCTTDDVWHNGPVIPMEWSPEMQSAVEDSLGFDPEDPEAIGAITGVVAGLESSLGYQEAPMAYRESSVDDGIEIDHAATDGSSASSSELPDQENPAKFSSDATKPDETPSEVESVAATNVPVARTSNGSSLLLIGPLLLAGLAVLLVVTFVMLRNAAHS